MGYALYTYRPLKGDIKSESVVLKGGQTSQSSAKDEKARQSRLVFTVMLLVGICILTRFIPLLYSVIIYFTDNCISCLPPKVIVVVFNLKTVLNLLAYAIMDRSFSKYVKCIFAKCITCRKNSKSRETPSASKASTTLLTSQETSSSRV